MRDCRGVRGVGKKDPQIKEFSYGFIIDFYSVKKVNDDDKVGRLEVKKEETKGREGKTNKEK